MFAYFTFAIYLWRLSKYFVSDLMCMKKRIEIRLIFKKTQIKVGRIFRFFFDVVQFNVYSGTNFCQKISRNLK